MVNWAAIHTGRLLEIRVNRGFQRVADVDELFESIGAAMATLAPDQRAVTVVDWRNCPLMASDAAERALARMSANNPRVQRSGAIASHGSEVAVLQFLRLVRRSGHQERRLFFETDALFAWLSEVLTEQEIRRLAQFLSEPREAVAAVGGRVGG